MESCLPFEICQNILRNIFRAILRLGRTMPAIKPVSDLRSYNEVLSDVHEGSPVFLTKNGRGRYAILDMKDFDRLNAAGTLMSKPARHRESSPVGYPRSPYGRFFRFKERPCP